MINYASVRKVSMESKRTNRQRTNWSIDDRDNYYNDKNKEDMSNDLLQMTEALKVTSLSMQDTVKRDQQVS